MYAARKGRPKPVSFLTRFATGRMTPRRLARQKLATRKLWAYQFGAYDDAESAEAYDIQQDLFAGLEEELLKDKIAKRGGERRLFGPGRSLVTGGRYAFLDGVASQDMEALDLQQDAYAGDDADYAGGLGLRIKLKLPKFIKKFQLGRTVGKVAKVAAAVGGTGLAIKYGVKGFKALTRRSVPKAPPVPGNFAPGDLIAAATETAQTIKQLSRVTGQTEESGMLTPAMTYRPEPGDAAPYAAPSDTFVAQEPGVSKTPGNEAPYQPPPAGAPFDVKKLLIPGVIAALVLL